MKYRVYELLFVGKEDSVHLSPVVLLFKLMLLEPHLKVGDRLPTVRQLAVDLRINANTVAKVYAEQRVYVVTVPPPAEYASAQPCWPRIVKASS